MKKYTIISLLLISALVTTLYNMKVRILHFTSGLDQYTHTSLVNKGSRIECFGLYESKVKVTNVKIKKGDMFDYIFGSEDLIIIDLEITNTGENNFISSRSFGSVYSSYHWVDSQGNVVADGVRSAILDIVSPGQTFTSTIVSKVPDSTGDIFLQPSLVQEGCAWFYTESITQLKVPAITIIR